MHILYVMCIIYCNQDKKNIVKKIIRERKKHLLYLLKKLHNKWTYAVKTHVVLRSAIFLICPMFQCMDIPHFI